MIHSKESDKGYDMLISICMPVYNMEDSIERAIRSALNQTYDKLEVIVVDNQSTDNTYKVAFSINDNRLKVIRNNSNMGAYGNHNRCLELANGEWVKFLHGDDELLSDCISTMVDSLKYYPDNIALVACGAINYGHQNIEKSRSYVPHERFILKPTDIKEFVLEGNICGTPSMVLVHRERLIGLGGFDLTMEPGSDGDCWINLRRSYACAFLPEHLVIIRDDPPGNLQQQINLVSRFCKHTFRLIDKWHSLDKNLSNISLHNTFYAVWLCRETFCFWDSALRYAMFGHLALLFLLFKELYSRDMIFKSWWFYFSNRLRGSKSTNFRGQMWTTALQKIRI